MDRETVVDMDMAAQDAAADERWTLIGEISESKLPADEYRVIRLLFKRIKDGHAQYGPLYKDKVDWSQEALAESADIMNYMAFRALYALKDAMGK